MSSDPWMKVHEKALAAKFVCDYIAGNAGSDKNMEEYISSQLRHLTKREILEIATERS